MPKIYITMDEIKKRLSKLDPNKAKGSDDIHPWLLKELADIVAEPLCLLFKLSFQTSSLPADWRTAIINRYSRKDLEPSMRTINPLA